MLLVIILTWLWIYFVITSDKIPNNGSVNGNRIPVTFVINM